MAAVLPPRDQFVNTVVNGFMERGGDTQSLDWIHNSLFNAEFTQEDVDIFARDALENFRKNHPKTDSKRYQFRPLTPSEELLKVIFDEAFTHNSPLVIRDAERLDGSFYGGLKKICLITLPKGVGVIIDNPLVKLALTVVTFYYTYKIGFVAYDKMVNSFNARALPFIINNTPLALVRVGNQIWNTIDWANQKKYSLLLLALGLRGLILAMPTIPYVTPAIRAVDIVGIAVSIFSAPFFAPITLFMTVFGAGISAGGFTWKNCTYVGAFFKSIAMKTEKEYLATAQARSYEVWKRVIAEMTPSHV